MKLIVSLTITLALMAAAATAVSVAEAAPAVAIAATVAVVPEAVAQEDIFDSYQSPPIWTNARPYDDRPLPDDSELPIQFRHGGARGGWGHGHDRDRIGTGGIASTRIFNNRKMKKRTAVFGEDAHFSLNREFGDIASVNAQVETEVESGASFEVYRKVKRDVEEEEGEEWEEEEDAEAEEEEDAEAEEEEDAEAEEEEDAEAEEEDVEVDIEDYQSGDFEFSEFMEDNQAEDEEAEEEEEDEEEEARLDSEAGLEDWIEEMKSEEYFNLAGHPNGEDFEEGEVIAYDENYGEVEEEEEEDENSFIEDEPSPSEEELFAASWHH
ncbi:hypothetical protein BGX24_000774 [Mortierella sp. AD032]|nr:hypothetical protein BGX24_000774 [Mortierella sp. AD032]